MISYKIWNALYIDSTITKQIYAYKENDSVHTLCVQGEGEPSKIKLAGNKKYHNFILFLDGIGQWKVPKLYKGDATSGVHKPRPQGRQFNLYPHMLFL